eukprot:2340397-Pleurochrysis_carterae.AAC.1
MPRTVKPTVSVALQTGEITDLELGIYQPSMSAALPYLAAALLLTRCMQFRAVYSSCILLDGHFTAEPLILCCDLQLRLPAVWRPYSTSSRARNVCSCARRVESFAASARTQNSAARNNWTTPQSLCV